MRLAAVFLVGTVLAPLGVAAASGRVIASHGVRVAVPSAWHRVRAASDGPVMDPRTLLVVGTQGVLPRASRCQIAAYHLPATAAVVVVVGWRSVASAGESAPKPGREPLQRLVAVHRPSFECFTGRGAVAQVLLQGRPYQINVMVGDRASTRRISEALAVARSFDLVR